MGVATVMFGPDHRQAAITYDRRQLNDLPTDAIRYALERLYPEVFPYPFEVWRDGKYVGYLLSEPFEPCLEDSDILFQYDVIITANETQRETGDFAPKEITV